MFGGFEYIEWLARQGKRGIYLKFESWKTTAIYAVSGGLAGPESDIPGAFFQDLCYQVNRNHHCNSNEGPEGREGYRQQRFFISAKVAYILTSGWM